MNKNANEKIIVEIDHAIIRDAYDYRFSVDTELSRNPQFIFQVMRRIADRVGDELFENMTKEEKDAIISSPEIVKGVGEKMIEQLSLRRDEKLEKEKKYEREY